MGFRLAVALSVTLIGFACYAAAELPRLAAYRVLVKVVSQAFA